METLRIDKFISVAAAVSRTDAKQLLKSGAVTVNGVTVKKADTKVCENDIVLCHGKQLIYKKFVYLILNKPKGVLSASTDKRVKTVVDLVPEEYKHYDLFPVGRLDKDTTGLLLITNDGDFAHKIISPKSGTDKRYLAVLDGAVTEEHIKLFAEGVTLTDGTECLPARLERAGETGAFVTVQEGKYHQIKRMFGVVGLGVNELERLSIGNLSLPTDLARGESRELTTQEFEVLQENKGNC